MDFWPVITIHQPWASLIAAGEKRNETRHWLPSKGQLNAGDILMIHAGKSQTRDQKDTYKFLKNAQPEAIEKATNLWPDLYPRLPFGAIVCACRVIAFHRSEDISHTLSRKELLFGFYAHGRFAWELEVLRVTPQPIWIKGQQGIWKWKPE